jgi:PAS domain S-box-containing protein
VKGLLSLKELENPQVEEDLRQSDETFRLLVESVQDYAIFLLSPKGRILTWNTGAHRIKGYSAHEIIGQHFSRFYSREAVESGWPDRELEIAERQGRFSDEGWRVRKDGTSFWASVVITALRGPDQELLGFSKVTRDLSERRALEERTQELNKELRSRMAQLTESRSQLELRTIELQRISGQLVRIQDDERRRIARELHDDLGQVLIALKMAIEAPDSVGQTSQAVQLADSALAKVRNISYLLHPPLLDESGLLPAIHWYVDGFRKRSGMRTSFEYKPETFARLPSDVEMTVFRVIQEALTNVYRHSGSSDARIEVHQQPDRVYVRVRDFGKGIVTDTLTGRLSVPTGAGIGGMRERVKQFGGEVKVVRAEPGTLVEAMIPIFQ